MFAFGLEEEQAPAVHILFALCDGNRPSLTHLRRGSDRICTSCFARCCLHRHDCAAAVESLKDSGIFWSRSFSFRLRGCPDTHCTALPAISGTRANWAPASHTIA